MPTELTNTEGISLALAAWLAYDAYDYNTDPMTISATTLLKSTKQMVLGKQMDSAQSSIDIGAQAWIAGRFGSAIHEAAETAWRNSDSLKKAFAVCGFPENLAAKVVINPDPLSVTEDQIPVYLEKRASKKFGEWTVSGKFDIVIDGALSDYKTTSVWTYVKQRSTDKFIQQGSIYRALNPDIITEDFFEINYIFTDWAKVETFKNKEYPTKRVLTQKLVLMGLAETERFIKTRLNSLERFLDSPQNEIPDCTPDELWMDAPIWKYYKNAENTARSTKNFDNAADAYAFKAAQKGVGIVLEVRGKPKACNYCDVADSCAQRRTFVINGELT